MHDNEAQDTGTPTPAPGADTLTRRQVADACRVSLRTVSRWLDRHELEGARQDDDGVWLIPRDAILSKLPKGAPGEAPLTPGRLPAMAPENADELERLRHENAELRRRAEVAEAVARERGDALEDARLALRALTAGAPPATPTPAPTPDPVDTPRRRWWSR